MSQIQHIVFLGESHKFINVFKSIYKNAQFDIFKWRELGINSSIRFKSIDLIIVCGYDYKSSTYSFKNYIKTNVNNPVKFIKKIASNKISIIYINTMSNKKKNTYSRYEYAKNLLALKLKAWSKKLNIIQIPTIVNKKNDIDIHAGSVTKLLFYFLIRCGMIKTVSINKLKIYIEKNLEIKEMNLTKLNPRLLVIKRPLLLDRILRLISV